MRVLLVAVLLALLLFSIISRTSIFIPSDNTAMRSIFGVITITGIYSFNVVTLLAMVVLGAGLMLDARIASHRFLGVFTRVLIALLIVAGFLLSLNLERLGINFASLPAVNLAYILAIALVIFLMGLRAAQEQVPERELVFWVLLTIGSWLSLYEPVGQYISHMLGQLDAPPGIQYTTYWGEAFLVLAFAVAWVVYWLIPVYLGGRQADNGTGLWWWVALALAPSLLILGIESRLPGVSSLVTKFALGYNTGLPKPLYLVALSLFIFTILRLVTGGGRSEQYTAGGLFLIFASGFQQLDSYHYMLLLSGLLVLLRARTLPQLTEANVERSPALTQVSYDVKQ